MSGSSRELEAQVISDRALGFGSKALFALVARLASGDGFAGVRVSQKYLASCLARSDRTIRLYLSELKAAGYLESEFRREKCGARWVRVASFYRFVLPKFSFVRKLNRLVKRGDHLRKACTAIDMRSGVVLPEGNFRGDTESLFIRDFKRSPAASLDAFYRRNPHLKRE